MWELGTTRWLQNLVICVGNCTRCLCHIWADLPLSKDPWLHYIKHWLQHWTTPPGALSHLLHQKTLALLSKKLSKSAYLISNSTQKLLHAGYWIPILYMNGFVKLQIPNKIYWYRYCGIVKRQFLIPIRRLMIEAKSRDCSEENWHPLFIFLFSYCFLSFSFGRERMVLEHTQLCSGVTSDLIHGTRD